jgi:hypothetical protein
MISETINLSNIWFMGRHPLALCPTGRLIIDIFHFGTPPGCEVRRILKTRIRK